MLRVEDCKFHNPPYEKFYYNGDKQHWLQMTEMQHTGKLRMTLMDTRNQVAYHIPVHNCPKCGCAIPLVKDDVDLLRTGMRLRATMVKPMHLTEAAEYNKWVYSEEEMLYVMKRMAYAESLLRQFYGIPYEAEDNA